MDTQHIQAEIDALRVRLKKETSIYKQAIADGKGFEEVRALFFVVKATLGEIFKAIERYGNAIRVDVPECVEH